MQRAQTTSARISINKLQASAVKTHTPGIGAPYVQAEIKRKA